MITSGITVENVTANIQRLIKVLSENTNSDPYSAIREYVANAHDATRGRERPLVRVVCGEKMISIHDNGCGMTKEVIKTAFTRIAGHLEHAPGATIGRFGLGVLSAFMIADRLVVETQAEDGPGWRLSWAKGADTFELEPIKRSEAGTVASLHLSPQFEGLAAEPGVQAYLAKTFGLFTTPVLLGAPGFIVNRNYGWLAQSANPPTTGLLNTPEAFELIRQYCRLNVLAAYVAHLPGGARIFLGIPEDEHAPLDKHRVGFFSHGVWVQNDAARFFPENLAFVVGLVDHPAFALQIDRQAFAQNQVFVELREVIEHHILVFLEALSVERPTIAGEALATHSKMLLAHSHRSERLRTLLKRRYQFHTNLGAKLWDELKGFAEQRDGDAKARTLNVVSAGGALYTLDAATAMGRQVVQVDGMERTLIEAFAAQDGIQLVDAQCLIEGTEFTVVPEGFRTLAGLVAAPLRRRGIASVSFFQLRGETSSPSMFKIAPGLDRERSNGGAAAGVRQAVIRVEALMLNVWHPLIEKLAGSAATLDGKVIQRIADVLYSIAALNSPFQEARAEVAQLVASLLVDSLDVCRSKRAREVATPIAAKCFVALPYSDAFAPVWRATESILSQDPYLWQVVRADQDVRDATVLGGVMNHVTTSRRFVVDISGQNVNVMLELGMMLQQDIGAILLLTDDQTMPLLPADLRGHACAVYPHDLRQNAQAFAAWFASALRRHPEFAAMRGKAVQ